MFSDIGNVKYPHKATDQHPGISNSKKSKRQRLRYIIHRTTAYHCRHSLHAFTESCKKFSFLTYDSWSALPWKHEPRKNSIKMFLKTPVVFSGFSLLSLERPSLAVFAGVQDVVHLVFHISIKWEEALLVHHFLVRQLIQFFGIITNKEKRKGKKERQGLTFFTLINSFNWKMSIITTFPSITGLVVHPFFYEGDHYIFCHVEFVSIWWLSCLERLAYLPARPFFIAPSLEAHVSQPCLVVFKLHQREPTFLFVNCTWKLNER